MLKTIQLQKRLYNYNILGMKICPIDNILRTTFLFAALLPFRNSTNIDHYKNVKISRSLGTLKPVLLLTNRSKYNSIQLRNDC